MMKIMKKMNDKTKWFYTEFKNDTKAVVLLAHGLNLRPSKMDQLAYFFNSKKCDVLRISLGHNPEQWTEKFSEDYDAALEHAEVLQLPIYFVGYSLGGLIGIHYLLRHPHHRFSKLALLAPATHTHLFTKIPGLLGSLFPKLSLPSFNLKNYLDNERTTLAEYKKMHVLQKEIKESLVGNPINIPTLLITSPKDELVASSKLTKFAALNPQWTALNISNNNSPLPKKYHHLMIDSDAIGAQEWENLLQNLTEHFRL